MSAKYTYTCDYCNEPIENGTMVIEILVTNSDRRQEPFRHAHPSHNPTTFLKSTWVLLSTGTVKSVEFRNVIATSA